MRQAWLEIRPQAIVHNLNALREIVVGNACFMGVIKANGYGHGAVRVAQILQRNGVAYFGVATLQEGMTLRENGIGGEVLIFGQTSPEDVATAINHNLSLTVYAHSQAVAIDQCARNTGGPAKVHLKIDTGLGRTGYLANQNAVSEIQKITHLASLKLAGIYSHFAIADQVDSSYTLEQFAKFQEITGNLEQSGIEIPLKHIANSAAIINYPATHLDLVRAGIALYGYYPDAAMARDAKIQLQPAMTARTRLVQVKEVDPGSSIGYGCAFTSAAPMIIGTIPLGYGDGYPRSLSNQGEVLIGGRRRSIVGRICMDQFMADISEPPIPEVGDEVVILGAQGEEAISADEIAAMDNTISYEILCRLGLRLERIYQ